MIEAYSAEAEHADGVHGDAEYAQEWTISIQADDLRGAMAAVWACWEAWHGGIEPVSGACPESMGHRMNYRVKKTKGPYSHG